LLGGTDLSILTVASGVVDLLSSHGIGARPLFFITHSLGGIVVKAALRQSADSSDPQKNRLISATQGIVMFGTPNTGASMGNVCAALPGLTAMQSNELARADALLLELSQWFRGKASPQTIRTHAFYETERLNGQIIVDAASANPAVMGCDPVPLTANHVTMCKLPSKDHAAFVSVRSFIVDTCTARGLETGLDTDEADNSVAALQLRPEYLRTLFHSTDMRHLTASHVDERHIFVDPNIYHQNSKTRITTLDQLLTTLLDTEAAVISGNDRAGKSLISKLAQTFLDERGHPTILLNGAQMVTADILALVGRAAKLQYGEGAQLPTETTIIIDDFDECQLHDTIKERIVADLTRTYASLIVTAFTHAPSVLFAPSDRPDPDLFELSPLSDEKLLQLVMKWKRLGAPTERHFDETSELATFELLQKIFLQTELERFPGSAVSFLQLIDSSSGSDINYSSYAACYETLITSHITKVRPSWQNLDEARNFVAYVAFSAYLHSHSPEVPADLLTRCVEYYASNYFSSAKELREVLLRGFLAETEGGYRFREEYEWYFLCARHAANTLKTGPEYDTFVLDCTTNIFRKQYANMIVFMAYFNSDNMILSLLLDILDGLFSGAPSWTLSDEQKTIMLGLSTTDSLAISSRADNSENRAKILRERVVSILDEAETVVAQYTLPFINPEIGDSEYVKQMSADTIGADSYMKSINALMRVHSVIGQILASRSGTFDAKTMLDCITRMVQASGRYIALNHAISAVLIYDRDKALDEVDRAYDSALSKDEKLTKVERIFSFWSVYLSQAGLARYLSHDHAVRALKILSGRLENQDQFKRGHVPFNFTSVLAIASLYKDNELDRVLFEKILEKYGEHSAIIPLLRVAVHFQSYYLPLSIQDKQWLGAKLKMQVKRIEAQRRQAVFEGKALPKPDRASVPKIRRKKSKR
jgi:hypothetical protein